MQAQVADVVLTCNRNSVPGLLWEVRAFAVSSDFPQSNMRGSVSVTCMILGK